MDLVPVLFESHKEVVSGKILVFGNILALNWAQKWTKIFKFGYVPFPLKHILLKDCLEVQRLSFSYERLPQVEILANLRYIQGKKGSTNPQKGGFMDVASSRKHLSIYNLTATNAKLMKLTMSMHVHKKLNLLEYWGVRRRKPKTSQNEPENRFYGSISGAF